mgnify:CR=1 FL=1
MIVEIMIFQGNCGVFDGLWNFRTWNDRSFFFAMNVVQQNGACAIVDFGAFGNEARVHLAYFRQVFGEVDKSKLRLKKPVMGAPPLAHKPTEEQLRKLRKLRPISKGSSQEKNANLFDGDLIAGTAVEHMRFGRGKILKIEGVGQDRKAEIHFEKGGMKKLLLRFAKLKII